MIKASSININCKVINVKGLHARAAAKIVSISAGFESEIILSHKNNSVSGLSLIKLLTLDAPMGSTITITIIGIDANLASSRLMELFKNGFDELND